MANADLFVFLSVLLTLLFVISVKYYLKYNNPLFLGGILLLQIIGIYIYIELFRNRNSGILYGISRIIAIILVLILSMLLFEEQITLKQWIGIIIACAGLVLITY